MPSSLNVSGHYGLAVWLWTLDTQPHAGRQNRTAGRTPAEQYDTVCCRLIPGTSVYPKCSSTLKPHSIVPVAAAAAATRESSIFLTRFSDFRARSHLYHDLSVEDIFSPRGPGGYNVPGTKYSSSVVVQYLVHTWYFSV